MNNATLLEALGIGVTAVGGLSAELPDDTALNLVVSEFKRLKEAVEMLSAYQRQRQQIVAGRVSRIDPDLPDRAARAYGQIR